MKKYTLFSLLSFSAISTTVAQVKFAPEVGLHVANAARVYEKPGNQYYSILGEPSAGLRAGLMSDLGIGRKFSFQTGVYFLLSRFQTIENIDFTNLNLGYINHREKFQMSSIRLPLMIVYKTAEGKKHKGYVGGGLYFDYLLSGNIKTTTPEFILDPSGDTVSYKNITKARNLTFGNEPESDFNQLNYGFAATIGFEFPKGVFLRGMFQYPLSNAIDNGSLLSKGINDKFRIYNIGLSIGFYFGDDGNGKW